MDAASGAFCLGPRVREDDIRATSKLHRSFIRATSRLRSSFIRAFDQTLAKGSFVAPMPEGTEPQLLHRGVDDLYNNPPTGRHPLTINIKLFISVHISAPGVLFL